jgi:nitroreductase
MAGSVMASTPAPLSVDELLSTTRAVRRRLDLDRPVAREVIEECLTLAVQAPTGRNRQRWDFVVVTDAGRRKALAGFYRLGETQPTQNVLFDGVNRRENDPAERARSTESGQHLFDHLHEVPVLVVPCVWAVRAAEPSVVSQANTWGSILPAVWSFMLAARSRGLGTVLTTVHLHYEREVAELLDIPYETVIQAGLIPLAYTIGTDFKPSARVAANEVTHWNNW